MLKRLSTDDSSRIVASSSIPSYHSIVEELILNSIDAKSTCIEISVNLTEFFVEVRDNGEGVDVSESRSGLGEWHHSSKPWGSQEQHGFKGQALASVRHLSRCLEILSRPPRSRTVLHKRMTAAHAETTLLPSSCGLLDAGTVVRVFGVFEGMPVRQRAMRAEAELMSLQEFVHNMSVLHHEVSWKLVDISARPSRTLVALPAVKSVSKRIISLHGLDTLSKLRAFSYTDGRRSIEGLLSSPVRADCSISKDCQYLYINQRWMRNRDDISKFVNRAFAKTLAETLNYGPSAKHVKTQLAQFPHFVLKFSCPPSDCDILLEPDKTTALFRDAQALQQFLRRALLAFSAGRFPRFEAVLDELSGSPSAAQMTSGLSQTQKKTEGLFWEDFGSSAPPDRSPQKSLFSAAFLWPEAADNHTNESSTSPRRSDRTSRKENTPYNALKQAGIVEVTVQRLPAFDAVFADDELPHNTTSTAAEEERRAHVPTPPKDEREQCAPSSFRSLSSSLFVPHSLRPRPLSPQLSSPTVSEETPVSSLSVPVDDDIIYTNSVVQPISSAKLAFTALGTERESESPSERKVLLSVDTATIEQERQDDEEHVCEEDYEHEQDAIEDAPATGGVVFHRTSNALEPSFTTSVDYMDRSRLIPSRAAPTNIATMPAIISSEENVQIDRSMLREMRLVGQFANKFLACTHGSLLLLFDQHAVDERIRFEVVLRNLQSACVQTPLSSTEQVQCTAAERSIYLQKREIFSEWGFDFDLSGLFLKVRATPRFLDEQLTIEDTQEFNHFLFANLQVPKVRLVPPAVLRIAACKACRSAVKFGTALSTEHMTRLLSDLSSADFPFQCAHGRPSVLPMMQLKRLQARKPFKRPHFESLDDPPSKR